MNKIILAAIAVATLGTTAAFAQAAPMGYAESSKVSQAAGQPDRGPTVFSQLFGRSRQGEVVANRSLRTAKSG